MYQTTIVGTGPIGIETAAVLTPAGVPDLHLEAGTIGESIRRWPRNTRFFSSPEWIALAGIPLQTERQEIPTGEQYLAYMRFIGESLGLQVLTYEPVTEITRNAGAFTITTRDLAGALHTYQSRTIILATGDMNHARRLEVPGEDLPHVTHYWRDPHRYFQRKLLIVGGRNSALEAAVRCRRAGAEVDADFVYLATGFVMDYKLYRQLGLEFTGPESRPVVDPETMESTVPGVYVVGTATGGTQSGYSVFITTSHEHCLRAHRAIARCVRSGDGMQNPTEISPDWVGNYPPRDYPLSSKDVE